MPERPVLEKTQTFEGDRLLATLHHYNVIENLGLVYRGGTYAEGQVGATVPYWWIDDSGIRYADSEYPVVCADASPLVPAFCAVAPSGYREYFGKEGGGVHFRVTQEGIDAFHRGIGCVAIFSDEDFEPFTGGAPPGWPWGTPVRVPEMRANSDQTALFNIKISVTDFLHLLADSPNSSMEFCSKLRGS